MTFRAKIHYSDRKPVIITKATQAQLDLAIAQFEKWRAEGKSHFDQIERLPAKPDDRS